MTTLCEDEFFHLFSWLPAKSLCRFKSVCESSLNFTNETYFCMKNAQNMLLRDDTSFFIQQVGYQRFNEKIEAYSLRGEEESSSSGVPPRRFLDFLERSAKILASSNGLVLCRSKSRESEEVQLFICNPVMKTWLPVATPASVKEAAPDVNVDIVFQCINNDVDDYIITLIETSSSDGFSSHRNLKVYLPKEGVWEAMERSFFVGSRNMRYDMPVTVHNTLHLISDSFPSFSRSHPYFRPYIMTYSYDSGESALLRLPNDARRGSHDHSCNMGIFEGKVKNSDRSICLVRLRKRVFTVWILAHYELGVWRRILKIRVKAMGLKEKTPRIQGFAVIGGDCLVFATEKKVYGYNLCTEDQHFGRAKEICKHGWRSKVCFTSYSNTLRPCGTGATTFHSHNTNHPGEERST